MADDYSTMAGLKAILDDTALYDVESSVANAKRRIGALRQILTYASKAGRQGTNMEFDTATIKQELDAALKWWAANDTSRSSSNPSVLHADFSATGQYSCGDDRRGDC